MNTIIVTLVCDVEAAAPRATPSAAACTTSPTVAVILLLLPEPSACRQLLIVSRVPQLSTGTQLLIDFNTSDDLTHLQIDN